MSEIVVENLSFSYGLNNEHPVLYNINYKFESGVFYAITGPNGSGKTTMLNCINGVLKASNGAAYIENKAVGDYEPKELARKMSLVPQNTVIDFNFSVEEVVQMGRYPHLRRFQDESTDDLKIVEDAMRETGIYELRDKYINQISGGERQRAIVARALAQQTPIMLLDEPISMLDIYYQISIMDIIKKASQQRNTTVIVVLHDLNIAARYADEIILLNKGKIYASGNPTEVYTSELLKNVYNIDLKVSSDPENGHLNIRP